VGRKRAKRKGGSKGRSPHLASTRQGVKGEKDPEEKGKKRGKGKGEKRSEEEDPGKFQKILNDRVVLGMTKVPSSCENKVKRGEVTFSDRKKRR